MLARYLEGEGFRITAVENGSAMRARIAANGVDLVLLDLVLPGEDGLQLAREIRAHSDVGIIMLSGRSDLIDTVVGLEVGADDYIAKPFQLREVLARVKSVLRRVRPAALPKPAERTERSGEVISFDGWKLDVAGRSLTSPDCSDVPLTTGEYDMLLALARNPGRVLDRDRLMNLTRGREWEAFDRTIDAQIARLRKKVERDPKNPTLIKSVRGAGYVFTGGAGGSSQTGTE
jgi:two-component system phosphate regulon response regulator OmpR